MASWCHAGAAVSGLGGGGWLGTAIMTEAKSDVDSAGVPSQPSRTRRMIHILGAALVGVVLPVALLYEFLGDLGSRAMVIGLMVGVVGSKLGGTRRMLYLAPAVGIAGGLGAITAYHWSWVVLLAVVAIIAGAGMRFGWLPSLLMLTFAATFPIATSSVKDAAAYGAIAAIAQRPATSNTLPNAKMTADVRTLPSGPGCR